MEVEAGTMQAGSNGSGGSGCVGAAWSFFCQHPGPMGARYIYAALFLIGNVSAWVLRENPKSFFEGQRLSGCHGNRDCLASEAVLMISLANFLFFSFMFFTTLYTRTVHDSRNSWHSGWWPAKIILLLGCFMTPILAPDYFVQLYGKVAPFGGGLFLIIQLISVIRYIARLNSRWCGQENFPNHRRKVNAISILAYGTSIVGIILMIFWYVGCYMNAALVVSTVLLVYIMPMISLLSQDMGFYMEPMLMGVYIVFLCWSAIKSEPETKCYKKENTGSGVNWITMISFFAELASVTVAAFSTGTDYKCIQFTNVVESENDIPYGYGFFHFVFAMGSMYFGMLFLGWDTHHALGKWSMDVGWTSTIIHMVNEVLAVISFVAVILSRIYGIGWLQQLLGKMFGIGVQQHADEFIVTESTSSRTDNNGPPQESPSAEHGETETNNNGQPQEPHTTEREGTETDNNGSPQRPHATEPVGTETDNVQPSSSSSATGLLRISESQSSVLGTQNEIEVVTVINTREA